MRLLQIMKIRNIFYLIALFLPTVYSFGAEDPRQVYIDTYKQLAIAEMNRTGIPASIKLAQGLLESAAGKSTLATKAKNHFGIKCGGSWEGETYYRADDDYDESGNLIKSCFRKFNSVYDSYFAHSAFLSTQRRYRSLFSITEHNYIAWANGLRKAGYATDKQYANKLIKIIEDYQLYLFDQESPLLAVQEKSKSKAEVKAKGSEVEPTPAPEFIAYEPASNKTTVDQQNKTKRKRRFVNKSADFHIVNNGQSLKEIARLYELNEATLRIRNRLPKDAYVSDGQKILLRKKISLFRRPKFTRVTDSNQKRNDQEFIF